MKKEFHKRIDYGLKEFDIENTPENPLELFMEWLKEAEESIPDASAMVLSTVGELGIPSSRIVLLRQLDKEGIKFYTNYESQKGREMESNAHVAANFFWQELERQVCVVGKVSKLNSEVSDAYFNSRPRQSRIGAIASDQSKPLASRAELESRVEKLNDYFEGKEIPRPDYWGGYNIQINEIEFWQGKPSRLHDRLCYRKDKNGYWSKTRLNP